MNKLNLYDSKDKYSILSYAKELRGKTLRQACQGLENMEYLGKGRFGQTLEKFYFMYDINSNKEADFREAGLELKSSPLKQLIKDLSYKAKERVVLSIIDFNQIVNEQFNSSNLWLHNSNILFVFYLYEVEKDILDYKIKLVDIWEFPDIDLEIIKKDWTFIQAKVREGKAHELSEGDTLYLGACTKGSSSKSVRKQPNSDIPAKQRAYSLKQGYVNHIIASISGEGRANYGKLINDKKTAKERTIEEIVIDKFSEYYDFAIEYIMDSLQISNLNMSAKSFYASLTNAILGLKLDNKIEEFEKAGIIVKTVRLNKNNMPKEDISFPTFRYDEIVNIDWDDSDFKNIVESKFFFVFYQYEEDKLILKKVKFWNMPAEDRVEAKSVWEDTKSIVLKGNIIREIKKGRRVTNFPSKKDSLVAHVRPHAKNADDTYPLPINDKVTGVSEYTKHCFWLNATYVKIIYLG